MPKIKPVAASALSRARRLVLQVGGLVLSRGIASTGGIVLSIAVARIGGADVLGQFAYALSLAMALVLVCKMGLDVCLIRNVARWIVQDEITRLRPALADALIRVLLAGLGLSALLGLAVLAGWGLGNSALLLILGCAIIPVSLISVLAGYLKGRKRTAEAVIVEIGGLSLATAAVLGAALLAGYRLDAAGVAIVFLVVTLVMLAVLAVRCLTDLGRIGGPGSWRATEGLEGWRTGWGHFMLIAVAGFLTQAGALVLVGPFLTDTELGLARAAERLALLIALPLTVIGPYIAPRIVGHATRDDQWALNRLMRWACLGGVGLSLPAAILCLILPQTLLAIFGPGFDEAATVLRTLVLAQLINVFSGPLMVQLNMTGHEQANSRILIGILVLSAVLFPLGASFYGAWGFALASILVALARALLLVWYIQRWYQK